MSYISDFHTHLALKAANNNDIRDVWQFMKNTPPKKFFFFFNLLRKLALDKYYNTYATYTQCDLGNCVDGQLRVVNCALYPIERQYIARRNSFLTLLSAFSLIQLSPFRIQIFNKKKNLLVTMVRIIVGTSEAKAEAIWDEQKEWHTKVDYFKDYQNELDHLKEVHDVKPVDPKYTTKAFRLVKNYEELKANLANPDVISGIVSLEGIHGLATYSVLQLFKTKNIDALKEEDRVAFMQTLNKNLRRVKAQDYTPFYITMAHHYNNLLCGHVKSFTGFITKLFKQKNGLNGSLTASAMEVIENMLKRSDELKRILVDIKHMSVKARKDYYEIVREKNSNLMTEMLGIPIISSHSAVSGVKTLEEAEKIGCDKKDDKHSYVSRCDVNLCDEDIVEIFTSDGLIGVLMHEGRMPGKIYKKKIRETTSVEQRKAMQVQLFLTNVYHIVQVIEQRLGDDGWKLITLGSDMDGLIDPFDDYKDAGTLTAFRNDVFTYLDTYEQRAPGFRVKNIFREKDGSVEFTAAELSMLNHGRSISDVVNGIFYKHSEAFLEKYFTEAYLHGKDVGPLIT